MKKIIVLVSIFLSLAVLANAEDLKQQIGKQGDTAWDTMMTSLKDNGNLVDPPVSAKTIASNFSNYQNKSMLFPSFSFEDFVTDRDGVKYYYYGEPEGYNFFVIKYDDSITDLLRKYSYTFGPVGDDNWELLGTIEDVFGWWGDIVLMEIQAVRIKGSATVIRKDNAFEFVAEDLIDKMMDQKAADGMGDLPKNLTGIPSGLDPLTVAKLYCHIASEENNQDVWLELLSKDNFYNGKPERRIDTWWKTLTKEGRTFFYVRTATDTDTSKKYFFQIRENGSDLGSPKPLSVTLEDGEWKVKSGL